MPSRLRVLVCRPLPEGALSKIAETVEIVTMARSAEPGDGELRRVLASVHGVLCLLGDPIGAAALAAAPRLRVVSSVSVGVDHIDVESATALGIPVGHTPTVLAETTADLAFALLLTAARRVAEGDRFVRSGAWSRDEAASPGEPGGQPAPWGLDFMQGRDVYGATLGIVGLGEIGRAVARRAQGFGMRVLGWSRTPRALAGVEPMALPDLLRAADFVSVHVARTPETEGLLGREALALLHPHAVVVNTARGGIVDEDALAEMLRKGRLAAAGLDVFAKEPLPKTSPLLRLENVVLTPHIGSASLATRTRMLDLALANLQTGLAFEPLPRCANPQVYATLAYRNRSQAGL
ncbi:MAG TPA: D-glycerate dehydrogenase [Myxococcota bacterium]|nr:D-glycerate dehydrogenase [Myxococcota bacterium]